MDVCYHASHLLIGLSFSPQVPDYEVRTETPQGRRYFFFRDIELAELNFGERNGTVVRVSFSCPLGLHGSKLAAGVFPPISQSLKMSCEGKAASKELYSRVSREFWRLWGKYKVGKAEYCVQVHPYSTSIFRDCPERGRKVATKKQSEGLIMEVICMRMPSLRR